MQFILMLKSQWKAVFYHNFCWWYLSFWWFSWRKKWPFLRRIQVFHDKITICFWFLIDIPPFLLVFFSEVILRSWQVGLGKWVRGGACRWLLYRSRAFFFSTAVVFRSRPGTRRSACWWPEDFPSGWTDSPKVNIATKNQSNCTEKDRPKLTLA